MTRIRHDNLIIRLPSAETLARKSAGLQKRNDINNGGISLCYDAGRGVILCVTPWDQTAMLGTIYPSSTEDGSSMEHLHTLSRWERETVAQDLLDIVAEEFERL